MTILRKVPFSFLSLLLVFLAGSCVSTKQFNDLKSKHQQLQEERDLLKAENEGLTVKNNELSYQVESLKKEIEEMRKDSASLAADLKDLQYKYTQLSRDYKALKISQEELVRGNVKETRRLLEELQRTQTALQEKEDNLRKFERSLTAQQAELEKLRFEMEQRNRRLHEMEQIVHAKDSVLTALKKKVSDALLGFRDEGLTVTRRNGKIYVSMEEKLLFKTGSWQVDPRGQEALKKLARVLEKNPDINIMIEGHTDNVPYISHGGQIQDNWDLSVKRATSVVRILLKSSSIDPKRLTAAGRGEYLPVDPANTPAARRKNRRTEIILTPNLDELYDIIDNK
jgi:chemotaxis protein MotB